jgi:multicomponent Na+:H+ antiporter subunit D
MPIVYRAFFQEPTDDGQRAHGEAPGLMLLALALSAALTVALFFWPQLPLRLARDLVGG